MRCQDKKAYQTVIDLAIWSKFVTPKTRVIIPEQVLLSLFSAYPESHEQKKLPWKLLHLYSQPWCEVEHSS